MATSKISVNVIFLLRKKTYLCVTWLVKVKSRKEEKTKKWGGRCHTVDIKYSILVILSWFLAWIWPEWLTPIFWTIKQNRSRDTFYLLLSFDGAHWWAPAFEEIKNSLHSGHEKTLYQKINIYTWFKLCCNQPSLPYLLAFSFE